MSRKIPATPPNIDPALRNFLSAVREVINSGALGAVTNVTNTTSSGGSGGGVTVAELTALDPNLAALLSSAIPTTPTGFSATGLFNTNFLHWDAPGYTYHRYTEIWRAPALDITGTLIPASSVSWAADAKLVGTSIGQIYVDNIEPGSAYYYWIRFTSVAGNNGPLNASLGTLGQTTKDMNAVLTDHGWKIAVENLLAVTAWINSAQILDGAITSLKIGNTIQSDNYDGTHGWQISRNGGNVTLNQLTINDAAGNIILQSSAGGLDWSKILNTTGGRPANNATVGADSSNLAVGLGINLLRNTEFGDGGLSPWVMGYNPGNVTIDVFNKSSVIWSDGSWRPIGGEALVIHQAGRGTTYDIALDIYPLGGWGAAYSIPAIAGQRFEVNARVATHRCQVSVGLVFFDASGTALDGIESTPIDASDGGKDINNYSLIGVFLTAPAGTACVSIYFRKWNTLSGFTDSWLWITQPYAGQATPGQTEFSRYVPGNANNLVKITPSNASTYIANAAINNLMFDRASGNKLSINTLDIQGNAVVVPVSANNPSPIGVNSTWTTILSASINMSGGGSTSGVQIFLRCLFSTNQFTVNVSANTTFYFRILDESSAVVFSETIYGPVDSWTMPGDSASYFSAQVGIYTSAPFLNASSVKTYYFQAYSSVNGGSVSARQMVLMGAKQSV